MERWKPTHCVTDRPATILGSMTSRQVGALAPPLVWVLPIGAVEPHGPHLPLNTDVVISEGVARRLAERAAERGLATCAVLPALPYGVTECATGFPGRVHVAASTVTGLVADLIASAEAEGVGHLIVVNNHFEPAHIAAVRDGVERGRGRIAVAFPELTRRRNAARIGGEFQTGACHGGSYETSLVLAEDPGSVDLERARLLPPVPVDLAEALRSGKRRFREMGLEQAYCGCPAEADAAAGEALYEVIVEIHLEALADLIGNR